VGTAIVALRYGKWAPNLGAMVALGAVFWAIGTLGRRCGLTGETELVTEQAAASGTGPGQ